jgi:Toprim domain
VSDPAPRLDLDDVREALRDRIEALGEALFGQHNKAFSGRTTRRWGGKGSLALVISGSKRGAWRSHESGEAGGPIELVSFSRRCSFDEAVAWGANWAGVAPANDTDRSQHQARDEQRRRDREQRQARREAEDATDRRDRIAYAQRLLRRTMPIDGTAAEKYLQDVRRIPRPAAGWPACLCFLPDRTVTLTEEGPDGEEIRRVFDTAGALVMVATLPDGTVTGCQRVYLDDAGGNLRRSDGSKIKLTLGVLDGAAARLPGPDDGPLLSAEGPETALSAWAATGHATHVALGNMGNLRPPVGRRVVLCRDDDPAHSPADKALGKLVAAWRAAGVDLVVASPWPARRGDKSDLNDVLQAGGVAAVRRRIAAALDPGIPAPRRLPVDEGRRVLGDAVAAFFAEAAAWGEPLPDDEQQGDALGANGEDDYGADWTGGEDTGASDDGADAAPAGTALPVHLVQVDTGGGKSDLARQGAARMLATMREAGDKRTLAMMVPTHDLGTEQLARFEALPEVQAAGLTARIWRGRRADDPASPGHKMCRNYDLFREVQALKLDAEKQVCGICPHGPNQAQDCAYLAQRKLRADLWFAAHNMIFEAKPKALGKPAAVIVDESPLGAALEGVERDKQRPERSSITLLLDVLARPDRIEGADGMLATDRLLYLRRLVLDVLQQITDGPLPRGALEHAGLTAGAAREASRLEWRTLIEVELSAAMKPAERREALAKASRNGDLGRRVMLWGALAALLADDGPALSGWASLCADSERQGADGKPVRYLELKGRRTIGKAWHVPTLALDATARPELLRFLWPDLRATADVRLQAPHQRVRQTTDADQGLSRLDVDGARTDDERRHRARRMRDLHAIVCREGRRFGAGQVLVVAQERIEEALRALGNIPGNVELAHHNAVRGLDRWGGERAVVVIGRTLPPSTTIVRMTEALTGVAQQSADYERAEVVRELADGSMQAAEWWRCPDAIAEALRWQTCEAEVAQIIGRARGVNRTADNPVDVLVLSDVALPLPIEAVTFADLAPSPADLMLAAGGAALENATDVAAAYPVLWGNRETAKKALQRARLGTFPYKDTIIRDCPQPLMAAEYQRAGSGRSSAVAWVDPVLVPDPAAWLVDRLGPLAWCKVGGEGAELPADAGAPTEPEPIRAHARRAADEATEASAPIPSASAMSAMSDADKLAVRARLQGGRVPAPAGVAIEVPDGYGEGVTPAALFPGLDPGEAPLSPVTGLWVIRRAGSSLVPIVERGSVAPVLPPPGEAIGRLAEAVARGPP